MKSAPGYGHSSGNYCDYVHSISDTRTRASVTYNNGGPFTEHMTLRYQPTLPVDTNFDDCGTADDNGFLVNKYTTFDDATAT